MRRGETPLPERQNCFVVALCVVPLVIMAMMWLARNTPP